jgi:sugar (pentulose or hexulose) kinase
MSVILAIDIGSSSIRCTAYDVSNQECNQYRAVASQSQSRRSVQPGTGKILLANDDDGTTLLDDIDVLVDQVLSQLQSVSHEAYNVIAVGFSSFVMNLVGVDVHGHLMGDHATLSYACSQSDVNAEVNNLKRCVRVTGFPLSTSGIQQLDSLIQSRTEHLRAHTILPLCLGKK